MLFLLLSSLPTAEAAGGPAGRIGHYFSYASTGSSTASARWGQQAVFVPGQNAVYAVGGQVAGDNVTNDVLVLRLNESSPTWTPGPNSGLPANSQAAVTLTKDGKTLVAVGGMTASCSSDTLAHSLDLSSTTWENVSPNNLIRRRGAKAACIDDKSASGEIIVVGGIADDKACSSSSMAYTAWDVLSVPLSSTAVVSSQRLPSSLTGSDLAVSSFAMAQANDKLYLAGGRAADGSLVPHSTIGVYDSASGWTSKTVKGEVPAGRLGASLVAHPNLDLLVLYGGNELVSGAYSPSTLLAFLNTTTWEWSTPRNLQPPASSAVAYHSSVMTQQGVMVSAFGLGPNGVPSSNTFYLDMRDPTQKTWSWKSSFQNDMLSAYNQPARSTNDSHSSNRKTVVSAVVPTVILLVILVPLAIFFGRRYIRNMRKRRLASHYSFEAQEDNGDFHRRSMEQYGQSRSAFYPFGFSPGDSQPSFFSNAGDKIARAFRLGSTSSRGSPHGVGDDGTISSAAERELTTVVANPGQLNEKGNWEEIDFGLGRVDQERREATYTDLPARRNGPRASLPRRSSFSSDGEHVMIPASQVGPAATLPMYMDDNEAAVATGQLIDVTSSPRSADAVPLSPIQEKQVVSDFKGPGADADDWDMLETSLQKRPAFRSISPTATLGARGQVENVNSPFDDSHAVTTLERSDSNGSQRSRISSISAVPSLPPLEFNDTPLIAAEKKRTITPVGGHARSVSGPSGRLLTGATDRRVSLGPAPKTAGYAQPTAAAARRAAAINALGVSPTKRVPSVQRLPSAKLTVTNPDDKSSVGH